MKTKVLIIEDNAYKTFTTKQVLETQLKLQVNVVDCEGGQDVVRATEGIDPDMIVFCPNGGVAELLEKMKKRRTNRRNTEITLMLAEDLDDELAKRVKEFVTNYPKRIASAA